MELLSAGTSRDDRDERWGDGAARGGDRYGRRGRRRIRGGLGRRRGAREAGASRTSRDLDDGRRGTAGDTMGRDPSRAAGPCDRMTTIDATASGTVGRRPGTVDADEPGVRGSSSRARRVGETVDPLSRRACGGHSGRIARTGVYPGSLTWCLSAPSTWAEGLKVADGRPGSQPLRNVLASPQHDCGSRLLRALRHASRAAGRSS